jgi:hypothetical protein
MASVQSIIEFDSHNWIEAVTSGEVGGGIESETIHACRQVARRHVGGASVFISRFPGEFFPALLCLSFEHYRHTGGGSSDRRIEQMCGDGARHILLSYLMVTSYASVP